MWQTFLTKWKRQAPDGGMPTLQHHVFHACACVTMGVFFAGLTVLINLLGPQLPPVVIGAWAATVAYLAIEGGSILWAKEDPLNSLHDVVQAMTFLWPLYWLLFGNVLNFGLLLVFFLAVYFIILYYKP